MRYNRLEWHIGRTNMDTWWLTKPMENDERKSSTFQHTFNICNCQKHFVIPIPKGSKTIRFSLWVDSGNDISWRGKIWRQLKKHAQHSPHPLFDGRKNTQKNANCCLLCRYPDEPWPSAERDTGPDRTGPEILMNRSCKSQKKNWVVSSVLNHKHTCFFCWKSPIMSMIFLLPPFIVREFCHCPPPVQSSQRGHHGVISELQLFNLCLSPLLSGFRCWIDLEPGEKHRAPGQASYSDTTAGNRRMKSCGGDVSRNFPVGMEEMLLFHWDFVIAFLEVYEKSNDRPYFICLYPSLGSMDVLTCDVSL